MRIGIAQINTLAGAFTQTVERMVAQSQRAAEQEADLVVFPLAALAGVDVVPYADRLSYVSDLTHALEQLAGRLACPALVPLPVDLGLPESYCEAVLIRNGEVQALREFTLTMQESEMPVFTVGDFRFAVAFSHEDLDELSSYDYHADGVIFISGLPFAMDDPSSAMGADLTHGRYLADAQAMGCWLVGVAPVGGYGDQVFAGASFVASPEGELQAAAPAFEEALLVVDLEEQEGEHRTGALALESFDSPFFLWQAVSLGIHDYVTKQGYHDVALCLDGSLGSMVLAALATDALGPTHVHALVGLSAGSSAPSCRELARRIRVDQIDSVGPVASLDAYDLDALRLAEIARSYNALVLSPLDKTALALDQHVGELQVATLCPLGDVYRSDILDMAHVRNTISPLFRKVALGDRDALMLRTSDDSSLLVQTEQDLTEVDEILLGYVEYDRPLADLVQAHEARPELVDAVLRAVRSSEPLRRAQPPVLAMSTNTLDDARFPLGVSWHDTHFELSDEFLPNSLIERLEVLQELQADEQEPTQPRGGVDVEGTLAMLRDLAEQGGFVPQDASLGMMQAGAAGESWPASSNGGDLGWMLPFSEN